LQSGIKILKNNKTKNYLVSFALGLSVLMLLIYFPALAGYLYNYFIVVLLIMLALISYREIVDIIKFKIPKRIIINLDKPFEFYRAIIFSVIFFLLSVLFVGTLKPVPMDGDSLHVYFSAPLAYATEHKFLALDYSEHANMGQNLEMIYAGIIALFGTSFVINLNWLALILILLALFSLVKNLFDEKSAWLATLLVFLMPMNIYFITTAKVDLWQVFYLLIITLLFVQWQKEKKLPTLLLIGWLAGIAVGIKYTSVIFLVPIYAVYFIGSYNISLGKLFSFLRLSPGYPRVASLASQFTFSRIALRASGMTKKILPGFIISVLIAIIAYAPWGVKNIYYFNAPLHPLSYFSFENKTENADDKLIAEYAKKRSAEVVMFKHGYEDNARNPISIIKTLWRQSIGHKVMPAMSHNFGWLPFLMIIPILIFKKNKTGQALLWISIASTLLWHLAGNGGVWYIYFAIILLYIFCANLLLRFPLSAWISIFVMLTIFSASVPLTNADDWLYRKNSNEQIIAGTIPNYGAIEFFNSIEKNNDDKLMVVGSFRVAYIDNPLERISSIDIYFSEVGAMLREGNNKLIKYLRDKNIRYIMFSDLYKVYETWPQFKNITLEEYLKNYSGEIPSLYEDINKFIKFLEINTNELYNDKGYYIYETK
jgi:hypothetical protein